MSLFSDGLPLRRLFWRLGLIWPLMPLVLALWLGATAWGFARDAALLARTGVQTEATIIKTERVSRMGPNPVGIPSGLGRRGRAVAEYRVTYHFKPDGQEPLTRSEFVGRDVHADASRGRARVTYAPGNPQIARLDPSMLRSEGSMTWSLAGLALLVSFGLGWWQTKPYHALLPILFRGQRRTARVTAIKPTGTRMGRHDLGVLEWRDSSGGTGVSMPGRLDWLQEHPPGHQIIVFVDPETGRGWWAAQM